VWVRRRARRGNERHEAIKEWLDTLADREKGQYGLSHVTVDRNKTDGYYIQVGKSAADGVPDHYEEIKTLKNSKRFTTDELEEKERAVLRLEERRGDLEYELFEELREQVAARAELLQDVGRALATVDALASLATHAAENRWIQPELHQGDRLTLEQGRHPVVEQTTEFVPNNVRLDEDRGFLVVTGPNMSGKSTYMRQVACIVLLAQIGSFVPAKGRDRAGRRHLHFGRRAGRTRTGPVDVHGRNERALEHPSHGDRGVTGHPGRGRTGHRDVRRHLDCVGRDGVPSTTRSKRRPSLRPTTTN